MHDRRNFLTAAGSAMRWLVMQRPEARLRAFNRFYAYVVARIVRRHQKPYRVFAFGSGIRFQAAQFR
jgi:hypothetical protein